MSIKKAWSVRTEQGTALPSDSPELRHAVEDRFSFATPTDPGLGLTYPRPCSARAY